MSEVLFILTTVFVAYVVYTVVNDQKAPAKVEVKPVKQADPVQVVAAEQAATATPPPAEQKPTAKTPPAAGKGELRNPKTGEVSKVPSNYRFSKRWIKDILVEEGLLEKVYKNNELDEAVEEKIKAALLKLEAMEKYKA